MSFCYRADFGRYVLLLCFQKLSGQSKIERDFMDIVNIYMSYSWDEEKNQAFIDKLVKELHDYRDPRGKFKLECLYDMHEFSKKTQNIGRYMSDGITGADFILILVTPSYTEKANVKSDSGVWAETVYIEDRLHSNKIIDRKNEKSKTDRKV